MENTALTKTLAARRAIAEARSVDEVKNIRDKAEAIRVYARQSGLGLEMINDAAEIKLRAERRAGEMLAGMEKQNGARGVGKKVELHDESPLPPTLADMGVSATQSYRWQAMASVPEEKFEKFISEKRAEGEELTTSGAFNLVKTERKIEKVNTLPFEPQAFNLWNFPDRNPAFGIEYPGNIPGDIIQNLLWLYTEVGALVVDPFAGGGVTHDVCQWWSKKMWPVRCLSYDANPSRPEIETNDITTGYPPEANGAALVFLDPPYWKQKRGDYQGGVNLADLSLEDFHEELTRIVNASLDILSPGRYVALIIGATRDGKRNDHAADLLYRLHSVKLIERIIVPYSSQQAMPYHVTAAREGKLLLNRYRDLLIWQR